MKDLVFRQLLPLAIAEGDTTPNPGFEGAHAYSTSTSKVMEYRDGAWHALARIYVGTVQPSTPAVGDLWVDTN